MAQRLLLLIGFLHALLWSGDVLMAYALSSVFLLALRPLPNRALISLGVVVFLLSIGTTLATPAHRRHHQRIAVGYLDHGGERRRR